MKTYLLLRNNTQMGYFTRTCLLQIGLQPLDLLWIDGESITWKYPSELEELSEYVAPAPATEATVVNNRKEKQILYFDSHMVEMEYKKVNIQFIEEPDAFLHDINPGFEYLVMAQDFRLSATVSDEDYMNDIEAGQQAVNAAKEIINPAYQLLGTSQQIDVPECQADKDQITTLWRVPKSRKNALKTSLKQQKRFFLKSSWSAIVMGIITIASAVLPVKI